MRLSQGDVIWPVVLPAARMAQGGEVRVYFARGEIPCEMCGGSGQEGDSTCLGCGGGGWHEVPRVASVIVPAGTSDGQRLIIDGQGEFDAEKHCFGRLVLVCWSSMPEGVEIDDGVAVSTVEVAGEACEAGGRFTVATPDGPLLVDLPGPLWDGREFLVPRQYASAPWGDRGPLRVRVRVLADTPLQPSAATGTRVALLTAQAREALLNGRVSEAIQRCREALAADQAFAMAHAVLGAALTRSGNAPEAIKELKAAVHLDHRQERYWFYLGCAYRAAGVPAAAAAAAYAGILRNRRSTRLARLWRDTLVRLCATDASCWSLSADALASLELVRTDLQRQYIGSAVTALAELARRYPGCARLRYLLGTSLWLLSVDGLEARLGAACAHVAYAIAATELAQQLAESSSGGTPDAELFQQVPELLAFAPTPLVEIEGLQQARSEYAAAFEELLELTREDGAVSDLVEAATALIAEGQLKDALPLLLTAADRILKGRITGWYGVARAELRGEADPLLASERAVAEAIRSTDTCLQEVARKVDHFDKIAETLSKARPSVLQAIAGVQRELQTQRVIASSTRHPQELCGAATILTQQLQRLRNGLGSVLEVLRANSAGTRPLLGAFADGWAILRQLRSFGASRPDILSASPAALSEAIDGTAAILGAATQWLARSERIVSGLQRMGYRALAAARLIRALLMRRYGPDHVRHDVRPLAQAIRLLHQNLHADVHDVETRTLLARALNEFQAVAEPLLAGGIEARADLFDSTIDAVRTGAMPDHPFADSEEELLRPDKLACLRWAAEALTTHQPLFPREFLIAAKRDCYVLTNYRLLCRESGSTGLVPIPLPRLVSYEVRPSGLTSVTLIFDLADGTRAVFSGVHIWDAPPQGAVRWALGSRMWTNLPQEQASVLESGQKVTELPRPAAPPAQESLPAPPPALELPALEQPLCPFCGTATRPGDRFCRQCGRPVALPALPADEHPARGPHTGSSPAEIENEEAT